MGGVVADIAQAQQLRSQRDADAGGRVFRQLLTGVLAQGVGHFVAHDHGHLIVGQAQGVQNAGVKGDFSARHAKGVDVRAANQRHLPLPLAGTAVPLGGKGDQALGNGVQALHLGIAGGHQAALGLGLLQQLCVLLLGRLF